MEKFGHVDFVGINFYARPCTGKAYIDRLIQIARYHGLGMYLDGGTGIQITDQTNCTY